MKIFNITRLATGAGIAGALVVAAFAFASGDETKTPPAAAAVTDPASLPKFDHVLVVNGTPEQIAAAQRSVENSQFVAGQRAYIDAETKQLRPAFPEELAAEAAAARSAAPALPADGTRESVQTESGAVQVALDDSFMSYAVARIEPNGSVKQDCLENQPNEKAALSAAAAAPGADSHEQ